MVRVNEKRWEKKKSNKTEKCCEIYLGSNVSDFNYRFRLLFASLTSSITVDLDSASKDHSGRILI